MLRIFLAATALAAVAALGPAPAQAAYRDDAPWCAVMNVGAQGVIRNCSFWRFEDCVPYVIAGNRGFCSPNPAFRGPIPGLDAPPDRYRR